MHWISLSFQLLVCAKLLPLAVGFLPFSPSHPHAPTNLKISVDPVDQNSNRPNSAIEQSSTSSDIYVPTSEIALAERVQWVNYFISRVCNYSCKFCFHTQTNTNKLSLDQAKQGLKLLREAGTQKINFAGGEPFINDVMLGELCRYCQELGMAVSIISNGSLIKPYWMKLAYTASTLMSRAL